HDPLPVVEGLGRYFSPLLRLGGPLSGIREQEAVQETVVGRRRAAGRLAADALDDARLDGADDGHKRLDDIERRAVAAAVGFAVDEHRLATPELQEHLAVMPLALLVLVQSRDEAG